MQYSQIKSEKKNEFAIVYLEIITGLQEMHFFEK
jgi:hypothetical protein